MENTQDDQRGDSFAALPGSATDRCPNGTHSKTVCASWIFGQCPISCPHEGDIRKYAARTESPNAEVSHTARARCWSPLTGSDANAPKP